MGASSSSSSGTPSPRPRPSSAHGIQYTPDKLRRSKKKQSKDNLRTMCPGSGTERKSPEVSSVFDSTSSGSGQGDTDWLSYEYPFENIVLSGGGTKGYAYLGAVQAMEDCGVWSQIKRLGGTSIGAIMGSLLVVGCSVQEIANWMNGPDDYISWVFKDQEFGGCFALPNLWRNYGINAGRRFIKLLGQVFEKKLGKADVTFQEMYEKTGKELCISVTNLSRMRSEYCNWKTTPDLPVRIAVRMSMAVPVMMAPVKHNINGHGSFYYSDGSLLDHYPIHCFDDDHPIEFDACSRKILSRQDSFSDKTLGFFLVSEDTADYRMWREMFGMELPYAPTYIPQSKLAKYRLDAEYKRRKKKSKDYTRKQMDAELRDHSTGEWLHYDVMDRESLDVTNAGDVILRILQAMFAAQRKNYSKNGDVNRTVPINCGYVQTVDTVVEPADREFLIKQGYAHTKAFLKDYVAKEKETQNVLERKQLLDVLENQRNPSFLDELKYVDDSDDDDDVDEDGDSGIEWESADV